MAELFTNVEGPNFASGAGPVETITGIVDAVTHDDPLATGGQVAALGLQALGFMENPVQTLVTSAAGWIMEHLGPLDFALDATTGDPGAVEDASRRFTEAAAQLDTMAKDHAGSLARDLPTYFGGDVSASARAFHGIMVRRFDELRTASAACSGIATLITFSGEVVATTRGVIRDLIAEFAWGRIEKMWLMPAAPLTFGTAAAWYLADTLVAQASTLGEIYRTLMAQLARLNQIVTGLKELSAVLTKVLDSPVVQSVLGNSVVEFGKATGKAALQERPDTAASARPQELPRERPVYGPPSNARWTTSGTLDE